MKFKKILIITAIFAFGYTNVTFAQQMNKGVDFNFLFGLNIGATTPVPLPGALDLTNYNPKINPKFGGTLVYYFNERWGLGTGMMLEWKGMNVRTRVDNVHLSVDVPNVGTLTGYVTGRNKTQVNNIYLTQPVYGSFRINRKWELKTGVYFAEALYKKFKGSVSDVVIRVESPIEQEREVEYATLDYSSHARAFDVGLLVGSEFRMNKHVGFTADFTWSFRPYFSSSVPVTFTMRNVYFALGVTYRI